MAAARAEDECPGQLILLRRLRCMNFQLYIGKTFAMTSALKLEAPEIAEQKTLLCEILGTKKSSADKAPQINQTVFFT